MIGHTALGGSIALYDSDSDLAIAILVNRLTLERELTSTVVNHIVQETGAGLLVDIEG